LTGRAPGPPAIAPEASGPPLPAALLLAHPGHELRVHGWLQRLRPRVFVLTDGSGRTGRSRLATTSRVLARAGARAGSIYGPYPDRVVYRALLDGDFAFFLRLTRELADALHAGGFRTVIGDAAEGYNSTHDAWRLVVNTAVALAAATGGEPIVNLEFPLVGSPGDEGDGPSLSLADGALRLKLEAARRYAELGDEVGAQIGRFGVEAFRTERLRRAAKGWIPDPSEPPFYERHGEAQVRAGHYREVIRFEAHLRPLAEQLGRLV
jgi:hypothetical protein